MRHLAWLMFAVLSACAVHQPAPVIERGPAAKKPAAKPAAVEKDWRPEVYTVKKGDTLYGIGLEHGIDYKEIAQWNNIAPPYAIRIGQQLRLKLAAPTVAVAATPAATADKSEVVATPISIDAAPAGKPLSDSTDFATPAVPIAPAPAAAGGVPLLTAPKATKQPYSELAMAAPPSEPAKEPSKKPAEAEPAKAEPAKAEPGKADSATGDEDIAWGWPASGKILAGYNDSNGGAKGIDIGGNVGQPVLAAAAGKVVYSGSGLRGYGNLVIIKHNKTYLSAYAHNSKLLVKEGQTILKGQKIAEMGSSDASRVQLHFEIRKLGKPVDPAKYLPENPG